MSLPMRFPGTRKKQEDVAYSAVEVDPNGSNVNILHPQPSVPGWPTAPRRVSIAWVWLVGDLVLLLMPIAFIVLAALAYQLDGKPISAHGKRIGDMILLGPTLFPLAFAALGGRSLKKIALWKAQRGTTLGVLEHLIGSQSLVSAVGHAYTLRELNILTLGLLILWALSPLGGQSTLRLLYETNSTVSEVSTVFHSDVNARSRFPDEPYNEDMVNRVNAVLLTSLTTIDMLEYSSLDTWSHPKIPRIESLEQEAKRNGTDIRWYDVEEQVNQTYASLTGVDILNLSEGADANFSIPYEYMYFDCQMRPSTNQSVSMTEQMKYLAGLNNSTRLQSGGTFPYQVNSTSGFTIMERGFFIYGISDGVTVEKLLYGSQILSGSIYLFECSMNSVLLEANLICESSTCTTARLRRRLTPRANRNATHLPYDVVNDGYTFKYFITDLAEIGGKTSNFKSNPIDDYIYGVTPWDQNEFGFAPMHNWTEYIGAPQKEADMSRRLTKLLNTYWDASRWPMAITRNDPFGKVSLNATTGAPPESLTMDSTEAVITHRVRIYRANVPWVVSLVLCSSVLFLLGLASFIFAFMITAPDIFDYVSSFTRDNAFVKGPEGGSALDGATRARLLSGLRVQVGDVRPGEEEGYIALRSVEGREDEVAGRVKKGRMYL
ncbi:hypothetical protein BDW02DRAFT_290196 [Decorospora gaudefroyi]|uniref:Uncharacterized protein n=1 Tax=Decorospora gaudefroyi TaxID=184978 RepID=A0A6A5KIN3_9PLEO|nr:hypothetical protein BDW02DRAFT_290196 [Decorospora gaudefroyi]